MNSYSFALIIALLILFIGERIWHERRIDKLLDRLMSRNFDEFNYYEKKYDKDLKQESKYYQKAEELIDKEDNKAGMTNIVMEDGKEVAVSLDDLEEDWAEEQQQK